TLVTDRVAEGFSRTLRERDRAVEEVRGAHVVRIVDAGNESRKGNRFDDAGSRKSADSFRVVVQLQSGVGGVDASRKCRSGRQAKQYSSLSARGACFVFIVNATTHIEERKAAAINHAIIIQATGKLGSRSKQAEAAALAEHAAVNRTTTFIRHYIHDATDRVRSVQRRSGAAQHFNTTDIGNDQVF